MRLCCELEKKRTTWVWLLRVPVQVSNEAKGHFGLRDPVSRSDVTHDHGWEFNLLDRPGNHQVTSTFIQNYEVKRHHLIHFGTGASSDVWRRVICRLKVL